MLSMDGSLSLTSIIHLECFRKRSSSVLKDPALMIGTVTFLRHSVTVVPSSGKQAVLITHNLGRPRIVSAKVGKSLNSSVFSFVTPTKIMLSYQEGKTIAICVRYWRESVMSGAKTEPHMTRKRDDFRYLRHVLIL